MRITHKYLKENQYTIDWYEISRKKFFAKESNIRKWKYKVNWYNISYFQVLSEEFIREFKDYVDWKYISMCQNLSEDFIREFKDKVYWHYISAYQTLSEPFIREFNERVDWNFILKYQTLSENFIREFEAKVDWKDISEYQNLTEPFIREFKKKVNWDCIAYYQTLTSKFRKEFNLPNITPEPSREKKIEAMSSYAKQWKLKFDGEFLFAYREHDQWGRGVFNQTRRYSPGNYYQDWHCNYEKWVQDSFGLGIWPKGNTPVKVSVDDFGIVVNRNDGKCRVKGFHVLHRNKVTKCE